MTNAMIVLVESVKLMEAGVIKGSGIKGTTPEGKEIELPEAIHTYQTWKSMGYQVKKGEKAVAKFPIWKHTSKQLDEIDEEGNQKVKTSMFLKTSAFFSASQVENWKGSIEINGTLYNSIVDVPSDILHGKVGTHIKLYPLNKKGDNADGNKEIGESSREQEYRITVKKYMTEKATPSFDFMAKWNQDVPMPLRTMTGKIIQETRGMVKMELHGDMYAEKMCTCMRCGRPLTNKVSQYFGIGPECGDHNYVNPFDTEEELKEAVKQYRKKLQEIKWIGWIIKSAITEKEEM